ncbi:hypothetical protein [Paraburkholderia sp.]|uniref:hypothetical protein n=1 Tax=Paraburkholderia sp. TaxID=1926495 RepID=UPI0039E3CAA8
MIKYLSPQVLAAVLRASSTPVFSIQSALTSLPTPRETRFNAARTATCTQEGTSRD